MPRLLTLLKFSPFMVNLYVLFGLSSKYLDIEIMPLNFRLFLFTEGYGLEPHQIPKSVKGATTRLALLAMQELVKQHPEVMLICINLTSASFNKALEEIRPGDIGLFIRFQHSSSLEILRYFQTQQGLAFFHLADPHVLNDAHPELQSLHRMGIIEADGVIATSSRLADLARSLRDSPDMIFIALDAVDVNFQPVRNSNLKDNLQIVTACYPVHHESVLYSLPAIEEVCREMDYFINWKLVTEKQKKEQAAHGKYVLDKILNCYSPYIQVEFIPFSIEALESAFSNSNACLIPPLPKQALARNDFRHQWIPMKGSTRIVQSFAAGIPIILAGEIGVDLPQAYDIFVTSLFHSNSIKAALKKFLLATPDERQGRTIIGQKIAYQYHHSSVIADTYWQAFKKCRSNQKFMF